MLLGKKVLGEALARSEAAKGTGKAVVNVILGRRLLGAEAVPIEQAKAGLAPVPTAKEAASRTPSGNRLTKATKPRTVKPAKDAEPSFTEDEVLAMLDNDAHAWPRVLEAEGKRAEGPRPAVAALVLAAADRATELPVPAEVLAELEVIAAGPAPVES